MKIQKKHAVAVSGMISFMAVEHYYPLDDSEVDLISRCLGFAVYHNLIEAEELTKCRGYKDIKYTKTARLDLTRDDLCAILSMHEEVSLDANVEGLEGMPAAIKYLEKAL